MNLIRLQMSQGLIAPRIPAFAILIVNGGMTMKERTATNVFTRDTDAITFSQQSSVGQILAHAPVDRQLAFRPWHDDRR